MALFKRNNNKEQAAEDLAEGVAENHAEGMAEDLTEGQPEDTHSTDPAPRKRFGKRKRKPKRDLRGVVRIEELEQALADQDLDDIDPDAVVSMYMPKRRMERIGAALLRMDKLQKALVVLALVFGVLFALSFMQENMGNFTINLNRLELFRRGVAIADNGDFNNATARLAADALDNGTNIAAEDLPDNLDDIDGSHNGKNYVAYTFYIRNAGKTDLGYSAKLKVVSASKGVEKAARVRVYRNGEPTTYAAAATDGNPEPNTEPFASKDVVTTISHANFRVGDVDKYTVVIWLDGDDPECVDKIIGGAVEFGFDFDSSETDDSSLFVKFVQDIADTLTGNDPISASGNEAPDYYKEHNVTWSNRRNQKNSPAGDGDKLNEEAPGRNRFSGPALLLCRGVVFGNAIVASGGIQQEQPQREFDRVTWFDLHRVSHAFAQVTTVGVEVADEVRAREREHVARVRKRVGCCGQPRGVTKARKAGAHDGIVVNRASIVLSGLLLLAGERQRRGQHKAGCRRVDVVDGGDELAGRLRDQPGDFALAANGFARHRFDRSGGNASLGLIDGRHGPSQQIARLAGKNDTFYTSIARGKD